LNRPEVQTGVLGEPLELCSISPLGLRSISPMTGFTRNGCCETGFEDIGSHTMCVQLTEVFLEFSQAQGNDLSLPDPGSVFPALNRGIDGVFVRCDGSRHRKPGAPKVVMRATHERTLEVIGFTDLKKSRYRPVLASIRFFYLDCPYLGRL